MKVLIVVDKDKSAIHKLALDVQRYNEHHEVSVISVHPKRPSSEQLNEFLGKARVADVIDFQYWKTAMLLREEYGGLLSEKKIILAHHNPYDIDKADWSIFDLVITNNKTIKNELYEKFNTPSELVYNSVDISSYEYLRKYEWNKTIGMVAGRIEAKKGIKEVAEIAEELGYKFILVGRISDRNYFNQFKDLKCLDFREDVSEEDLRKAYHEMGALIVNSVDNFESGPMPPIEAMASGIPVVSNSIGTMKDILRDGNNSVIHNRDNLKTTLENISSNDLDKLRANAWQASKRFDSRRRARIYSTLWNKVVFDEPLVSVILPTSDRLMQVGEIIASLQNQTHHNLEIVISDDGDSKIEQYVPKFRAVSAHPIKYVKVDGSGYQLAKARNLAVIEAEGDYLLILDDRLKPNDNAIETFLRHSDYQNQWLYGNKGGNKRSFVENFSFIRRKDLITAGMFSEACEKYGYQSQELRERFRRQGYMMNYVSSAKATPIMGSKSEYTKKADIVESKFTLFKMYE